LAICAAVLLPTRQQQMEVKMSRHNHFVGASAANAEDAPGIRGNELDPLPQYVTVTQFCEMAQLGRSAVYSYIRRKLLIATRLPGGDLRISRERAARFMETGEISAASVGKSPAWSTAQQPSIRAIRPIANRALELALRKSELRRGSSAATKPRRFEP
jgi:hypothetical protein